MSVPVTARCDDSVLALVHLQSRLFAAMSPDAGQRLRRVTRVLLAAATELAIPVLVAEQNPAGLGATDPAILGDIPDGACRVETDWFSACRHVEFANALEITGRRQVMLAGMEAHVCVLQTALDLRELGYDVFVARDGVCSRDPAHRDDALLRLAQQGVILTNVESTLFEWLGRYRHPAFRNVTALLHEVD